MKLLYTRFRNCFSFGNEWLEINWDSPEGLAQIIGKNGVGKTTISRILKISVYQEYEGLPIGEVSNSVNGNGEMESEWEANGHRWRVRSDYSKTKLNSIQVFKDGSTKAEDWGKTPETKEKLKKEALDVPFHLFNNIISLNVSDFKSFLNMSPKDTRNIRDRLFSFYILNEMLTILKTSLNKQEANMERINGTLTALKEHSDSMESKMEEQKKLRDDGRIKRKGELEAAAEAIGNRMGLRKQEVSELEKDLEAVGENLEWLEDKERRKRLKELSSELSAKKLELAKAGEKRKAAEAEAEVLRLEKDHLRAKKLLKEIATAKTKIKPLLERLKAKRERSERLTEDLSSLNDRITRAASHEELAEQALAIKEWSVSTAAKALVYDKTKDSLKKVEGIMDDLVQKNNQAAVALALEEKGVEDLTTDLKLYDSGVCPTCDTKLDSKEQSDRKSRMATELDVARGKVAKLREFIAVTEKSAAAGKSKITELKGKLRDALAAISAPKFEARTEIAVHMDGMTSKLRVGDDGKYGELDFSKEMKAIDEVVKLSSTKNSEDYQALSMEVKPIQNELDKASLEAEETKTEADRASAAVETLEGQLPEDADAKRKLRADNESEYDKLIDEVTAKFGDLASAAEVKSSEIGVLKEKVDDLSSRLSDKFDGKKYLYSAAAAAEEEGKRIEGELERLVAEDTEDTHALIKTNAELDLMVEKPSDSVDEAMVKELKEKVEKNESELKSAADNATFMKIIEYALSEEGVKAFILRDIVPSINSEVSRILAMLDINISCIFDEEFKPTLHRYGREASLKSISTGQTKMIDTAILVSITKIFKIKYPTINVVFYDEIFSSLHSDAINVTLGILKSVLCGTLGMRVFVINHSFVSSSFFSRVIEVKNTNGFSTLKCMSPEEYESKFVEVQQVSV